MWFQHLHLYSCHDIESIALDDLEAALAVCAFRSVSDRVIEPREVAA